MESLPILFPIQEAARRMAALLLGAVVALWRWALSF